MKQYLSKNSTVIGRRETCRPSSNRNQTVSAVFFFFPQIKSGRSVRGNAAQLTGSEELKVEWNPSCLLSSSEGGSCTRQTLHLPLSFLLPRGIKATQHWWRGSRSLISYLILLYTLLFGCFFVFFSWNNWKMSNTTSHNFQKLKTTSCFVPAVRKQNIFGSLGYKTDKKKAVRLEWVVARLSELFLTGALSLNWVACE